MRRNHGDKELSQLQTLKKENEKLKKQVAQLRKQLARLDIDRYSNLKDLLEDHYEQEDMKVALGEKAKQKWKCHECPEGTLKLVIITRKDGAFYFRKCSSCSKRTKTQRYHENVEGVT